MIKSFRGVEYDNSESALIMRTTERPKYLADTFPALVKRTSPDTKILILNNCRDDHIRQQNYKIVREVIGHTLVASGIAEVSGISYHEFPHLLGVPGSINTGVKKIKKIWPEVKRVFVCDDDALAPVPKETDEGILRWDEALSVMLEAGWKVAGHPSLLSWFSISKLRSIGGIQGYVFGHLAGAFAGFSIETWESVGGVPGGDRLYGFGPFCNCFKGGIGYWADPQFLVEDYDRLTHTKSLRLTEYFKWYQKMRPNQAREIEHKVGAEWQ